VDLNSPSVEVGYRSSCSIIVYTLCYIGYFVLQVTFCVTKILSKLVITCNLPDPHFHESGSFHYMHKAQETILSAQIQQFAFQKNRLTEELNEKILSSMGGHIDSCSVYNN
jgi:hypothetical protein